MRFIDYLRVRSYPSVSLQNRSRLPKKSGVYYAMKFGRIRYIGLSENLHKRWNSSSPHHKLATLEGMGGVRLYYRLLPVWSIAYYEAKEMHIFKPDLNDRREYRFRHANLGVLLWEAIDGLCELAIGSLILYVLWWIIQRV